MNALSRAVLAALLAAVAATAPVLTLASSAWSECAWVMWMKQAAGPQQDWLVVNAFSSEQQCRKDQVAESALEKGKAKEETFMFLCLPDTIDPRAPKASGR